ncbi:acyl-CoA dehydrogenase family protein [Catellatospora sp. NPDC049609]|uniref:acyl-CoA dehydrogenase family protein n=1 Tax=Catellatospora sp. NPDC049609 TaxID=3155505 RepID=UPI003413A7E3
MEVTTPWTAQRLRAAVDEFLAAHDPRSMPAAAFLGARYDAGLAWVHFPPGRGGLGASRDLQPAVDAGFEAAGAPQHNHTLHTIGLGMGAPTVLTFGTDAQRDRWLRPLWTGEEVWCQLFSEPGAGSDLAALSTRAVYDQDTGEWVVNGQKVWTSIAHEADWAMLVTRTDPDVPKHRGLTYFVCDMHAPGVEVRPLRQATGEAEFNEVFLTDVRIPDAHRLGAVGEGWQVATGTLMNERVAIGALPIPREGGVIGALMDLWRQRPELRTPGLHDAVLRAWVDAEALRLTAERLRQQLVAGQPGPEGSAAKLLFGTVNQHLTGLALELLGQEGLGYDDWTFRRPDLHSEGAAEHRPFGFHYLRARGNSIEGGTTEVQRNIIAERVLGLPPEIRTDKNVPWKDLPR